MLVDFSQCPDDPIEAIMWLSGVNTQVRREVDARLQRAYFDARFTGRLDAAISLGYHSRKRILSFTRAENEVNGRLVRWGDGR